MSALPVAVLVLGGTSDLPSRVTFIFSANAGPAKATVAPSASVASMILVFDMVSSCWRQVVVPDSKQRFLGFIPVTGLIAPNFQRAHGRNSRHTRHRIETDRDGSVNVATNFSGCHHRCRRSLWRVLVANGNPDRVGRYRAVPSAKSCQRTDGIQRRRMFLLSCRARPARSFEARRRARDPVAVRHLLRA